MRKKRTMKKYTIKYVNTLTLKEMIIKATQNIKSYSKGYKRKKNWSQSLSRERWKLRSCRKSLVMKEGTYKL